MNAKDTLLLNNTITQNLILGGDPGFGMLHHILFMFLGHTNQKLYISVNANVVNL